MTTRTGEPEDPRVGANHGKECWCATCQPVERLCTDCGARLAEGETCCEDEEPIVADVDLAQCRYCGAAFLAPGDDCGGCRLSGEELAEYSRARAASDAAARGPQRRPIRSHSPAPWRWVDSGALVEDRGTRACILGAGRKRGSPLPELKMSLGGILVPWDPDAANARLIEAAPEALAACDALLFGGDLAEAIALARAAVGRYERRAAGGAT